jgi:carboxypeptidase Taq
MSSSLVCSIAAGSLLSWDQATYMPRGGAPARSRQSATLRTFARQQLVDPAMGRLLDALAPFAERLSPDSDDTSLIGVARRDFEKALKVPPDHVARASALGSAAYDAWTRARPANDFATMLPFLEKAVDLSRVRPTTLPPGESRASARLTKPSGFGLADESLRPNWFGW